MGYFISRTNKFDGKKTYWHGFSKTFGGHWGTWKPIHAYYESKHAQAVMTRKGWLNNGSCYKYEIEKL